MRHARLLVLTQLDKKKVPYEIRQTLVNALLEEPEITIREGPRPGPVDPELAKMMKLIEKTGGK